MASHDYLGEGISRALFGGCLLVKSLNYYFALLRRVIIVIARINFELRLTPPRFNEFILMRRNRGCINISNDHYYPSRFTPFYWLAGANLVQTRLFDEISRGFNLVCKKSSGFIDADFIFDLIDPLCRFSLPRSFVYKMD